MTLTPEFKKIMKNSVRLYCLLTGDYEDTMSYLIPTRFCPQPWELPSGIPFTQQEWDVIHTGYFECNKIAEMEELVEKYKQYLVANVLQN